MSMHTQIDVWQGEISELEVDAIVVPASESLFMTSPIASAVKRRAGDEVERDAVSRGPLPAGSAVLTGGGRLAASYVIHAVAVGHELRPDAGRLTEALDAALTLAEELGLRRLALAPLGSERGVFSPGDAARLMLSVVARHAEVPTALDSVVIAVGPGELAAYRSALGSLRAEAR